MKQSDIAQQLNGILSQQNSYSSNIAMDSDIPSELEEPAPVFEIDYDSELNKSIKTAYETVRIIVKSVVPESYQGLDMLENKMLLDANQLGMLYYQQKTTDIAMRRAMDIIGTGSTDSKIFTNIERFQKRIQDLSAQIIDTQNQFRKFYIDTYLDMETKIQVDESLDNSNTKRLNGKSGQKSISSKKPTDAVQELGFEEVTDEPVDVNAPIITEDGGVRFSGNKNAVNMLNDLKKERYKKSADLAKIEETN